MTHRSTDRAAAEAALLARWDDLYGSAPFTVDVLVAASNLDLPLAAHLRDLAGDVGHRDPLGRRVARNRLTRFLRSAIGTVYAPALNRAFVVRSIAADVYSLEPLSNAETVAAA